MPQRLRATVAPPNCILCDGLASPPSRMGWLQAPDRQAVFWVCGRCSDCEDAELEKRIVDKINAPTPAAPARGIGIGTPAMTVMDVGAPKWAARAASDWTRPLGQPPHS